MDNREKENKDSLVRSMIRMTGLDTIADYNTIISKVPFVIFLAVLGGIHIANNHKAVSYVREISSLEKDIKELRWEYMSTKSELMFNSKQSEVAKVVEPHKLNELTEPPYIIDLIN